MGKTLDFTAIDFETANGFRGSPCSVGLVKVRSGVVVDEFSCLIRPPAGYDDFSPWNVKIHKITADMVQGSAPWTEVYRVIRSFVGDDVIVAHNADFDIDVMRYACAATGEEFVAVRALCSLRLSRAALALPSYRLPFVSHHCGVDLPDHHDALADARACAAVVTYLGNRVGARSVEDLAAAFTQRVAVVGATGFLRSTGGSGKSLRLIAQPLAEDADPDGYLYDRVVVFTGKLSSMTRREAWDCVSRVGGRPQENTTKRTNVLVIGDLNPAALRPGATLSARAEKAFRLQDEGQEIELMTEADFLSVLDGQVDLRSVRRLMGPTE